VLFFKITFWTLAYILSSDGILEQVKMEADNVVGVDSKSRLYYAVCIINIINFHFLIFAINVRNWVAEI